MIDPDSLECSDTPMAYSIVRDLMRMHRLEYAENCPFPLAKPAAARGAVG